MNCSDFFPPSPRHKNQSYCMKPGCRRAQKADWKRNKMKTDPIFKENQKLSNKKWAQNNPGYWREYRKRNPEKVLRNRMLQLIRNRRQAKHQRNKTGSDSQFIAKVDASISNNFAPVGQFWLVPVIKIGDSLFILEKTTVSGFLSQIYLKPLNKERYDKA